MELKSRPVFRARITSASFNRTLWNWNFFISPSAVLTPAFNRTLWNWNSVHSGRRHLLSGLLIVPYGIEISALRLHTFHLLAFNRTLWNWNLLIIFSGRIECTFNRTLWNWNQSDTQVGIIHSAFNRTLWNWNMFEKPLSSPVLTLLIVPYGIEIISCFY